MKNNSSEKKSFSIVEKLSGPQVSIFSLFEGPHLNSRKQI